MVRLLGEGELGPSLDLEIVDGSKIDKSSN